MKVSERMTSKEKQDTDNVEVMGSKRDEKKATGRRDVRVKRTLGKGWNRASERL